MLLCGVDVVGVVFVVYGFEWWFVCCVVICFDIGVGEF